MSKFIKVAAPTGPNVLFSFLAANAKIREAIQAKFPNIFTLIPGGKNNFFEALGRALQNPDFQAYLIADILPLIRDKDGKPLGLSQALSYAPGAFKYYTDTKGAGGESIASGDYQFQLEKLPDVKQLPPAKLATFQRDVEQIHNQFGNNPLTLGQKQQALRDLLSRYSSQLASFESYLLQSFPGLK